MVKGKRLVIFIAIMIFIALIGQNSVFAAADNALIANQKFDEWYNGMPTGWSFDTGDYQNTVSCFYIDENNKCVELDNFEQSYSYIEQDILLKPNTSYKITCSAKVDNLSSFTSGANIAFAGQTARTLSVTTSGNWQTLELYVTTDDQENQEQKIRLYLGSETSTITGSAYFDNLKFEQVSSVDPNRFGIDVGHYGNQG